MNDPSALLGTLAQSSAAIVAIVGGFLVSRLVALSSEREGVRRQLLATRDRLEHVTGDFQAAHSYRLSNSVDRFAEWVLEDLAKADDQTDYEAILYDNIPRGSSHEEMRPALDDLKLRSVPNYSKSRMSIESPGPSFISRNTKQKKSRQLKLVAHFLLHHRHP